jgi:hypothetical protein
MTSISTGFRAVAPAGRLSKEFLFTGVSMTYSLVCSIRIEQKMNEPSTLRLASDDALAGPFVHNDSIATKALNST